MATGSHDYEQFNTIRYTSAICCGIYEAMITSNPERKETIETASENKSEHSRSTRLKANLAYWERAIFQRRPGGNFWAQVQWRGRREKFSLGTPIRWAAAGRAREFYLRLTVEGWDAAFRELKPAITRPDSSTIGDFLDELKAKADLKPATLEDYAVALRKIVADVFDLANDPDKHKHRGPGYQRWLSRVHSVKLADLTPSVVQKWKRAFLGRSEGDPIRLRSARISANSFLRRAKSLFAERATKHLSIQLPSPLPFDGISFEPRQSMRYRSTINVEELTHAAHEELAQADPPAFLAFLLALGAGLRRVEIDTLEWGCVPFRRMRDSH